MTASKRLLVSGPRSNPSSNLPMIPQIEEVPAAKFCMARCSKCGLPVTGVMRNGIYILPKPKPGTEINCEHVISVLADGSAFRFPKVEE